MIRVLIVDDQILICDGLKAMLELQSDLQVVGTAHNGEVAIEMVAALQPDLVLMDVRMPLMDGRAATRIICERFHQVKVLVLSTFDDDHYIADSIRAGAKGYLLKAMPAEALMQAVRLAHQGYAQLAPGLLDKLMQKAWEADDAKPFDSKAAVPEFSTLTRREQQVIGLLAKGATNKEIAEKLFIAEGTVKTHVKHLFERLDCSNRTQLALVAHSAFTDKK